MKVLKDQIKRRLRYYCETIGFITGIFIAFIIFFLINFGKLNNELLQIVSFVMIISISYLYFCCISNVRKLLLYKEALSGGSFYEAHIIDKSLSYDTEGYNKANYIKITYIDSDYKVIDTNLKYYDLFFRYDDFEVGKSIMIVVYDSVCYPVELL